jgi:acyl carrier protein
VLILFETTTQPAWFETSIGLIEGWSRFEDKWRQGDPLLTPEQWQSALQANGFQAASAWPEPGSVAEVLGAHIVIAQIPATESHLAGYVPASLENADRQETDGRFASDQEDETSVAEMVETFLRQLREVTPGERHELLIDYVRSHVIKVTRTDPSLPPHPRHRLMDIGVDSLMAVELSNRLGAGLGMEGSLTATLVFDYPTIEAISIYLAELLDMDQDEPADGQKPEAEADKTTASEAQIEDLSEKEVEELLLKKLENFQ